MSIGLTNALNNYKIPAGADLSMSSSREINPNNITCYNWNRVDSAGRQANGNTFATRTSGCTSAEAQIRPENALRPQYVEFLNGGGIGIQGNLDRGLNQVCETQTADGLSICMAIVHQRVLVIDLCQ